ncbi:MAG: hypothetical protein EZS28_001489 [Streblomastix strix]|uniref:Uncharacterized protein n=1 Tax=Streblomastix strix TaxID=222440 RepID=A0A5J4X719_9EUKA|nr:MAG: hypothetical protein EZS28_001489 [Streblomastix strix]
MPQLIRVVAYTFDVNEQQVQLNEDVSTCCTRFMNDCTITLTEIRIGNVNIHALDENKVNLLRDTYKLFELFIFEQIAQSEAHVMDVIQIHDETLFGNSRYNKVGLVEQVQTINQQVIILQNAPQSYDQEQLDEMLLLKADKTDTYTKTETDTLQNAKADNTDTYMKTETGTLLDAKADKTELIDSYSKRETYARDEVYTKTETYSNLDEKADKIELIDSYSKTEDDALLLLKADKTDTYSKSETDTLLDAKADKTELIDSYSKSETYARDEVYIKTETDSKLDEKADKTELIDSYSKIEDDALLLLKADKTDTYCKSETDTLLDAKADKTELIDSNSKSETYARDEVYTKTETDSKLDEKADKTELIDSYSKSETYARDETEDDALLLLKADKTELIDSYSKIEDDALLDAKADKTDLTNYVDLTSAQTITGQKQFGIISVSRISKQSKNDASIPLAGGGDMLVSSLVTQPQLQEVRDIATGKSKAYVFQTQAELNDQMAIQDNVAKLIIGDNLYIVDKEVTDYWWDGTDLKVLETELPDTSNVVTTLGAATGSGNAITDISIDGNTLTPAKNKNFVDIDYDQSISGQKTFNTTIHSVGIMVQTYDSSSVVRAGGGVRSIADIQSASYSKSEDDALLLLKADKTQLIDSYSKGETDNLLNDKANTGVSYTKGEDDTLLFAKADKSQLIDSYTKGEDDALLLLKADKTELIDSYTIRVKQIIFQIIKQIMELLTLKGETDNLLNNKANNGVSYTKGEDDTLLFAKADKTQLIDSYSKSETYARNELYTKGETDNQLNNKANQSTTYTKTETDQLIYQIDTGDIVLSNYYTKTKTDEILDEKANTTDLSNYMTLGTSKTITANKTFNNACRFVSSIDGMSTVTGSSFVKSGADDTVVLLGAGGTKPISEFAGARTDLSNYYTKTQTYSQTEVNNKFVRFNGSIQQTITGRLKYVSQFDYPDETQDPVANTYLTMSEVDVKLTNVVITNTTQSVTGAKTFNANVTATGFVKSGKDDTSVLLAGGGDQLLSSFGGVQVEDITSLVVNLHSNITFNQLKLTQIGTFYTLMMEIIPKTQIATSTQTIICTVGSISNTITPPTPPSTTYRIQLATKRKTLTCMYSYRDFLISTDSTEAWGVNDDVGVQFSWML